MTRDPVERGPGSGAGGEAARGRPVTIAADGERLEGFLGRPPGARGVVLFAHGSGSGRLSPRNHLVAGVLREAGLATLLFDLLTEAESRDRRNVFDIPLLGRRLRQATEWLAAAQEAEGLSVGYFGASTGAAAALVAAAEPALAIRAVVSRGGRPDLADDALPRVEAPTLLLVGGRDEAVLRLNEDALGRLGGERQLVVVPGATHLFEEPGALDEVARLAAEWFVRYLGRAAS